MGSILRPKAILFIAVFIAVQTQVVKDSAQKTYEA